MFGENVGAGLQISGGLTVQGKGTESFSSRSLTDEYQEQQRATLSGGRGEVMSRLM